MSNGQKALIMAAGVFLAIALITLAVVMFMSAEDATKSAQNKFTGVQTELSQTSFAVYDNTLVSGSQVLSALRKFSTEDQFGIQVNTGRLSNVWYFNSINLATGAAYGSVSATPPNGSLTSATDSSRADYINPQGSFVSQVIRDGSGVVHGLIFTQK